MPQNLVYTAPPPVPADAPLRLYSNPICPFVQRVKLVLAAKGVQADVIDVHLQDKPQWYLDTVNPEGKVPTIEHNGHVIRESLIAFDYVDEVFGEGSVWPSDPYQKAMAKLFINDFGNKFIPNVYKHYRTDGVEESHTKALLSFLQEIEDTLKKNGPKPFIGGEKPNAADYLSWPWLERLAPLCLLNTKLGSLITKDKFPLVLDYVERMKDEEVVKKGGYFSPETHFAFMKSYLANGVHDYGAVDVNGTGVTVYAGKKKD